MSQWEDLAIQSKVVSILAQVQGGDHHFGRPFMTPYQIDIELDHRYHRQLTPLNRAVGGRGTGVRYSLAQYIALELSKKILSGEIGNIEGRYLLNSHISKLEFNNYGDPLESSLTGNRATLAMFRLRD